MGQYLNIKSKYPDAILLFRVGDFYETFGEDAITASKILGIALTKRKNGAAAEIELAGFPHHSVDTYLPKLVKAGYRVAICDQLEDPKQVKGIVKRGVTEVVTPGVAIHDQVTQQDSNNFLASIYFEKNELGLALLDISTGQFLSGQGNWASIKQWIASYQPSEILVPRANQDFYEKELGKNHYFFGLEDWVYSNEYANESLQNFFEVKTLKGFGIHDLELGIKSCGAIIKYLNDTQNNNLKHVLKPQRLNNKDHIWMDWFTLRNLELIYSTSPGGKSLYDVINHTLSPMGNRLLKQWLCFPLIDLTKITERQAIVSLFVNNQSLLDQSRKHLTSIQDIERILAKISSEKANPRDLKMLERSLDEASFIGKLIGDYKECAKIKNDFNYNSEIDIVLKETLEDEVPVAIQKGNVVRTGYNTELDEYRNIANNSKEILLKLQNELAEKTGISSLKISYNNVFGYYIEVRNTHKDKVPEAWHRKQTLVSSERYITEDLKVIETKILSAEEKIQKLETEIYQQLINKLKEHLTELQILASAVAQLDVYCSFAHCAIKNSYVKPHLSEDHHLEIKLGRHPVIEATLPEDNPYIPNDIYLDRKQQQILMITGPNMSGKSALLRQTALISILAQCGSYVPAQEVNIGIIDKIFTRVGASDNLAAGESTFMVEMTETSSILNNLSDRSLVLLDEIGRGTSTYDGISIAWAVADYLHNTKHKAKTLFATHYHELNEMTDLHERIKNYHVGVKELDGEILFLRKLKAGGSASSFGINVAKMAGMPSKVVQKAKNILKTLESEKSGNIEKGIADVKQDENMQLSFFQLDDPVLEQVKEEIQNTDINVLTPVEALLKLNEIKKLVGGK